MLLLLNLNVFYAPCNIVSENMVNGYLTDSIRLQYTMIVAKMLLRMFSLPIW